MSETLGRDTQSARQWREWLRAYGSRLLLFARQHTRSLEDAEDLVQSAILRRWVSRSDGSCPTMGEMVRAIRWAAIDQGRQITRRQDREAAYQQDVELRFGDCFEADFESAERGRLVQEALEALDPPQRDVIVLKIWGGMTANEIAEALELSPNTVSSRYRYGLGALKKRLGAVLS